MRILLVTPLYPPDIAELAPYIKELATRLKEGHTIEILTYGHVPETISGVTITTVEKSSVLPVRLFRFFLALYTRAHVADIVFTQNGPSVELPILLFSYITNLPIHMRIGDRVAFRNSQKHTVLKKLLAHTTARVRSVVVHDTEISIGTPVQQIPCPLARPEILPFTPYPKEAFDCFEDSWKIHVAHLTALFSL